MSKKYKVEDIAKMKTQNESHLDNVTKLLFGSDKTAPRKIGPGFIDSLTSALGSCESFTPREFVELPIRNYDKIWPLCNMASACTARMFACDLAEGILEGVEDKRCWDAVAMSRKYANGKAADEELALAREMADNVVSDASGDRPPCLVALYSTHQVASEAAYNIINFAAFNVMLDKQSIKESNVFLESVISNLLLRIEEEDQLK